MPDYVLREQPSNDVKSRWPFYKRAVIWFYHTIVPWIAYLFVTSISSTYRWRQMVSQELLELMSSGKPFAVAVWHSDMLLSQSLGKRLGWTNRSVIMVALTQAGEVETRILRRLGYYVVRGSEKKRGKEALEDMKDILNQGAIAAMVVDGPIGPAREVKAGVVELARFCQVPIVPVAFLPGNEWILPTWDRTRIPKPFSRCITTSTVPIRVPARLTEGQFEAVKADVKTVLLDLEQRKIGWDQALSLDMKLLSLFAARNSIARIRQAVRGAAAGKSTDDATSVARIVDDLEAIVTELGNVKTKYFRGLPVEIDWKRIDQIKAALRGACRTRDAHEVRAVATQMIPELDRRIEQIIRHVPLFAAGSAPGGAKGRARTR